jgi:hypothetical protein
MTISQIAVLANQITDESYSTELITGFVNQVIARINVTFDATLPMFLSADTDFVALSDNWVYLLFVEYAAYAIKANDGSLNEADRFRNQFETNFRLLEENRFKAIAEPFRGPSFGGIYRMDTSVGINTGWFTKRNNGDTF